MEGVFSESDDGGGGDVKICGDSVSNDILICLNATTTGFWRLLGFRGDRGVLGEGGGERGRRDIKVRVFTFIFSSPLYSEVLDQQFSVEIYIYVTCNTSNSSFDSTLKQTLTSYLICCYTNPSCCYQRPSSLLSDHAPYSHHPT